MFRVWPVEVCWHRQIVPQIAGQHAQPLSTVAAINAGIRRSRRGGRPRRVEGLESPYRPLKLKDHDTSTSRLFKPGRGRDASSTASRVTGRGGRHVRGAKSVTGLLQKSGRKNLEDLKETLAEIRSRKTATSSGAWPESDRYGEERWRRERKRDGRDQGFSSNRTFTGSQASWLREAQQQPPGRGSGGSEVDHRAPATFPFTTPASEFLYGSSVVESALRAGRRKLYKLYVYCGDHKLRGSQDERLSSLAAKQGVSVEKVRDNSWLPLFDKISRGRPHNGYCLEASAIKRPSAVQLLPVVSTEAGKGPDKFSFEAGSMSREEREINGYDCELMVQSSYPRYPFVVLLDGIVDLGNLGGIIRSAHFLGADAVAMSGSCAPLNPIALKASAGAAEMLPIITVSNTTGFVEASKASGWNVFASVAPPPPTPAIRRRAMPEHMQGRDRLGDFHHQNRDGRRIQPSQLGEVLSECPCILMLGSEGQGLKADLQRRATHTVSVASTRMTSSSIDSLNVSVAAGILMERFLRPLESTGTPKNQSTTIW